MKLNFLLLYINIKTQPKSNLPILEKIKVYNIPSRVSRQNAGFISEMVQTPQSGHNRIK